MFNVDNLASKQTLMINIIPDNEQVDIPQKRTPTAHEVIRKFDGMFPGIGYENGMYERDLLSHGSTVAAFNRRVRENTNRQNLLEKLSIDNKKPLAEVLDSIIMSDDGFFVLAKDKEDKPIIDHEKRTVKFFNRGTWKELLVEFLAEEESVIQEG